MAKKSLDLTCGNPMKQILLFSLPLVVGSLFQQMYSFVDTIMVGRLISSEALAAVGSVSSLNFLVIGFVGGTCSGFAIPLAKSIGAKNTEEFQKYLDEAHEKNNLTIYCHPQWSSTPPRYFDKLKGNFAFEIWNSGCAIEDDMDTDNGMYWDELLGMGIKIFGVATDDGHEMYHHCKGWVMVNAENNVKDILASLEKGAFYSSCGPVIKDFYVDDENVVHIETSECEKIIFQCGF